MKRLLKSDEKINQYIQPLTTYKSQNYMVDPKTGVPLWGKQPGAQFKPKMQLINEDIYGKLFDKKCSDTKDRVGPYKFKYKEGRTSRNKNFEALNKWVNWESYEHGNPFDINNCSLKPVADLVREEIGSRNQRCGELPNKRAEYIAMDTSKEMLETKGIDTMAKFLEHPDYKFDPEKCSMSEAEYERVVAAFEKSKEERCENLDLSYNKHEHPAAPTYGKYKDIRAYEDENSYDPEKCLSSPGYLKSLIDAQIGNYKKTCLTEEGEYNSGHYDDNRIHARGEFKTFANFMTSQKYDPKRCVKDNARIGVLCDEKIKEFSTECVTRNKNNEPGYATSYTRDDPESSLEFLRVGQFDIRKCKFSYERLINELKRTIKGQGIKCSEYPGGSLSNQYPFDVSLLTEASLRENKIESVSDFEKVYPFALETCETTSKFKQDVENKISDFALKCLSSGPYQNAYNHVSGTETRNLADLATFSLDKCIPDPIKVSHLVQERKEFLASQCEGDKSGRYRRDYDHPPNIATIDELARYIALPFSVQVCKIDEVKVSDEIDIVISDFAKQCATIKGNKDSYPAVLPETKRTFKSGDDFRKQTGFKKKLCEVDRDQLVEDISQELELRKKLCAQTEDIYADAYDFNLDASKYGSLASFKKLESFDEKRCIIDKSKLLDRLNRNVEAFGKKCQSDDQFMNSYDALVDENINIEQLQKFEQFDSKKCRRNEAAINKDIDRIIQSYATQCETDDENNLNWYPDAVVEDRLQCKSGEEYSKLRPYNEKSCTKNADKLKLQLMNELQTRSGACASHVDGIYKERYEMQLGDDVSQYKSLADFNLSDVTKFDKSHCEVDQIKLQSRVEAKLKENMERCRAHADSRYLESYNGPPLKEIANFEQLNEFEKSVFDEQKCTRDDAAISKEIDDVLDEFAKRCSGTADNKRAYPSEVVDRQSYSSGADFAKRNGYKAELCMKDTDAFKDTLKMEIEKRKMVCKSHVDGIYDTDYAMQLKDDVSEYKSLENFNESDETKFNMSMCVIDEPIIRKRINSKLKEYGKRCQGIDGETYTDEYDDAGPDSITNMSQLLDFEQSFNQAKCRTSSHPIDLVEVIDTSLQKHAAECVTRNAYNKNEYAADDGAERFDESRCVLDAPRLRNDLLLEHENRKRRCMDLTKDHDYAFEDGRGVPEEADIEGLIAIRSLDNFNITRSFNEIDCKISRTGLRNILDAEIETRKDRCTQEPGMTNKREYLLQVPIDISNITSARQFNEKMPYTTDHCVTDKAELRTQINAEIQKRNAICRNKGYENTGEFPGDDQLQSVRTMAAFMTANPFVVETDCVKSAVDIDLLDSQSLFDSECVTDIVIRKMKEKISQDKPVQPRMYW